MASAPVASSADDPHRSSILDVAAASLGDGADKTQKQLRDAALDVSSELFSSDDGSPWMEAVEVSSFGPADVAVTPSEPAVAAAPRPAPDTVAVPPAFAAPVFADSDLEHQDTVEMQQTPGNAPRVKANAVLRRLHSKRTKTRLEAQHGCGAHLRPPIRRGT